MIWGTYQLKPPAFLPRLGLVFGLTPQGRQQAALYMIFSDIGAVVGVGLRRLQEWGRLLAPTVLLIGVAQSIYCFLHPAKIVKYSANMSHMIAPLQHQLPEQFQTMLYRGSSVF